MISGRKEQAKGPNPKVDDDDDDDDDEIMIEHRRKVVIS